VNAETPAIPAASARYPIPRAEKNSAPCHIPPVQFVLSPETLEEQVKLTLLIAQVNAWNRIKIGFRAVHPAEEKAAP
jgi:hypothetical protein